jgi:hypothetical protein
MFEIVMLPSILLRRVRRMFPFLGLTDGRSILENYAALLACSN